MSDEPLDIEAIEHRFMCDEDTEEDYRALLAEVKRLRAELAPFRAERIKRYGGTE
jgi:hypothetical protein